MAKQRRTNSIESAIKAVTSAIRAEKDPNLTAEEKSVVVNNAMDIVDDSGVITVAALQDDSIEAMHEADDAAEAEAREAEAAEDAEQDETEQEVGEPPVE